MGETNEQGKTRAKPGPKRSEVLSPVPDVGNRLITNALASLGGDFPARWLAFAELIVCGETQADAYRIAFDRPDASNSDISARASRLVRHPKVAQAIVRLRLIALTQHSFTKAELVAGMELIAFDENQPASARITALTRLGADHGLFGTLIKVEEDSWRSVLSKLPTDVRRQVVKLVADALEESESSAA